MIDQVSNLAQLGDWIRTGLTGGVLTILLGFWLRKKKEDREGWGALIEALQRRHKECEDELQKMWAEVRGLRRMVIAQSSVRAIPLHDPSPVIREAAERTAAAVLKDMENESGAAGGSE